MKITDYVSPFQGNGEIHLPAPSYPASTWHFIKGLAGNTNPGAALPFGRMSVQGYSGGYPAGIGVHQANYGEAPKKLYDRPMIIGLSHFAVSGTGAIGHYYNYALTHPFYAEEFTSQPAGEKPSRFGTKAPDFSATPIEEEEAHPGYYAARTADVFMEATVSDGTAAHRYRYLKEGAKRLAIDFGNDGLYDATLRHPSLGRIEAVGHHRVKAELLLSGIRVFFDVAVTGGEIEAFFLGTETMSMRRENTEPVLLESAEPVRRESAKAGETVPDGKLVVSEPETRRYGVIFRVENNDAEVRVGVSFVSGERAYLRRISETRSFEEIRADAEHIWENVLSKIQIETDDAREKRIFYSNLYHTVVKPSDLTGDAFLFSDPDADFIAELATMWDIYKTQLPLLFTLYPEIGRKLLQTFQRYGETYHSLPHCLLLTGDPGVESKQARMLAEYAIADAFYRGIPADYRRLLELSEEDGARYPEFFDGSQKMQASHILDMAEAYTSLSKVAAAMNASDDETLTALRDRFQAYGRHAGQAFGEDGLMTWESEYYEGNRYNYSFRPMHESAARIALAGRENLVREARRFFGFTDEKDLRSRFEGFNNETDMEAPYFLHELGLRDEMCEVLTSGTDSMFGEGPGGIPGNADSGGLTAAYLWNAIGIWPVSGQNRMIVGSPRYKKTVLKLADGDFTVFREGSGIYTDAAFLNGEVLRNFEFRADQLRAGACLTVRMRETRSE